MANCSNCQRTIGDWVPSCPHCGVKFKQPKSKNLITPEPEKIPEPEKLPESWHDSKWMGYLSIGVLIALPIIALGPFSVFIFLVFGLALLGNWLNKRGK